MFAEIPIECIVLPQRQSIDFSNMEKRETRHTAGSNNGEDGDPLYAS